jgi:hypothetical protein
MSQQQADDRAALEADLADVLRHAAAHLPADEVRLLCFGCGIAADDVLPAPDMDDLFRYDHF